MKTPRKYICAQCENSFLSIDHNRKYCGRKCYQRARVATFSSFDLLFKRFSSSIQITPGCWNWTKNLDKDGYGQFRRHGKQGKAHRFSYTMYHGEIKNGLSVLHKCDNPRCVNPDHLFLGTHQDNMNDQMRKNRKVRGEQHPFAKLKDSEILEIIKDKRTQAEIAKSYGICQAYVSEIKRGKRKVSAADKRNKQLVEPMGEPA